MDQTDTAVTAVDGIINRCNRFAKIEKQWAHAQTKEFYYSLPKPTTGKYHRQLARPKHLHHY